MGQSEEHNPSTNHTTLTLPITAATNAGATLGPCLMRTFFLLMQYKIRTMMRKITNKSMMVRNRVMMTTVMFLISMISKPTLFTIHITASVFKFTPVKILSYCMDEEEQRACNSSPVKHLLCPTYFLTHTCNHFLGIRKL